MRNEVEAQMNRHHPFATSLAGIDGVKFFRDLDRKEVRKIVTNEAQIEAFEDTWNWNGQAEREFDAGHVEKT